jgi:hypothetical protein
MNVPDLCRVTGKRRFENVATAELFLDDYRRQPRASDHVPRRAYECGHCRGWHLTSWTEEQEEQVKTG